MGPFNWSRIKKGILAGLLLPVILLGIDWGGKVQWAMNYYLAKQIAQKEGKLVFVDVALSNCPPCRYLAQHVYADPKVADYLNKHFVPVLYLADKDKLPVEVANYFTGATPTIMFIKPNGELFYSFIGARPAPTFLKTLQQVYQRYKGGQ
jgi:uncharacterized protein YyaL (SSP411 family)